MTRNAGWSVGPRSEMVQVQPYLPRPVFKNFNKTFATTQLLRDVFSDGAWAENDFLKPSDIGS